MLVWHTVGMELTTVHLVRHGEVDNPEGVLYGRRDGFHLTQLGHDMAAGLAEDFADRDIRAVVASPLERAIETATPTAEKLGLPIKTDRRLIEADNKFEGVAVNKNPLILAHPRYWSWYLNPLQPSWGEPYLEIVKRMSGVISDAIDLAAGGEAVLVSHQLCIWTMRRFVEKKPLAHDPRRRECSLCSVTSLKFAGKQLLSCEYSEPVGHMLTCAQDMVPGSSTAATNTGN